MIWKNLLRRKIRTLLTVLSIAIGVAAIIILDALAGELYPARWATRLQLVEALRYE